MTTRPPDFDTAANDTEVAQNEITNRERKINDYVIDGIRNFALVEIIYAAAEIADALKELDEPIRRQVTTRLAVRRMQCPTTEQNITFTILDTVIRECEKPGFAFHLGNFVDRNGSDLP
ncbi:MAG: hypothetical protein J0M01_01560 [Dechloromonas sp.]|jgi:hypothetical protein|nr:hypothetical protein [Dechloromonas sp.]